jgi:hypothetical protein
MIVAIVGSALILLCSVLCVVCCCKKSIARIDDPADEILELE